MTGHEITGHENARHEIGGQTTEIQRLHYNAVFVVITRNSMVHSA